MTASPLTLTRSQILGYRRRIGALDERLAAGAGALRTAAWAGLQDSMPRAALLSIHARVSDTPPSVLDDPELVQIWGPRFGVYVVAADDVAIFTVGRTSERPQRRAIAADLAARLRDLLGDGEMLLGDAARVLGRDANYLKYATTSGTVLIRWDGARQPTIRTVPAPDLDIDDARRELARRHLHVFGVATPESFARWAGVRLEPATAAFAMLRDSLTPVRTPLGDAWILSRDESVIREGNGSSATVRLLPSGDTYYLLWDDDRELLIPDEARRSSLWTSRVWPGAVLVDGDVVGIWRRTLHRVTVEPWGRLPAAQRRRVEDEAASLPLPGIERDIAVSWDM